MNTDGDQFDAVKRPLLLRDDDSEQRRPIYSPILGSLHRCQSTSQVKNTILAGVTLATTARRRRCPAPRGRCNTFRPP
jgi:hypothetical protein